MTTGFRSPYRYFQDEMNRIPFEGPNWENWRKEDIRKKRFFLFQFMIWSYLFIAAAVLSLPFWLVTEMDQILGAPLLLGGVAFVMFGSYRGSGELI